MKKRLKILIKFFREIKVHKPIYKKEDVDLFV